MIKAFPDILRRPEIWRRCVLSKKSRNSIAEAVETASSAARSWEESKETKIVFQRYDLTRTKSHGLMSRLFEREKTSNLPVFTIAFSALGGYSCRVHYPDRRRFGGIDISFHQSFVDNRRKGFG